MLQVQLCLEESWHPPAFAKHNDPAEHGGLAKHARGKAQASGGGRAMGTCNVLVEQGHCRSRQKSWLRSLSKDRTKTVKIYQRNQ